MTKRKISAVRLMVTAVAGAVLPVLYAGPVGSGAQQASAVVRTFPAVPPTAPTIVGYASGAARQAVTTTTRAATTPPPATAASREVPVVARSAPTAVVARYLTMALGSPANALTRTRMFRFAAPPTGPTPSIGSTPSAAPSSTGLTATIGTSAEPQVVRTGSALRLVNPSAPGTYLPGQFRFTGVDAYELTTDWSVNVGCGSSLSDAQMQSMFRGLGPDSVVRAWFFQPLGRNKYTGQVDWTAIDRAVHQADQAGVHLIATLGNQDGVCDDGIWKDPSWYASGYRAPAPGGISYASWVQMVTSRYSSDPAIMAWEPINEPRPDTCTNIKDCWGNRVCPSADTARNALRSFFDSVGAIIRTADPNHLIADGAPPVMSCGALTWADLQYVESSPGIDMVSWHDYTGARVLPADSKAALMQLSTATNKPVFAGENGGIDAAANNPSCPTLAGRATQYQAKVSDEFTTMPSLAGWLFWNAGPTPSQTDQSICWYGTYQGDPLLNVLSTASSAARASTVAA